MIFSFEYLWGDFQAMFDYCVANSQQQRLLGFNLLVIFPPLWSALGEPWNPRKHIESWEPAGAAKLGSSDMFQWNKNLL